MAAGPPWTKETASRSNASMTAAGGGQSLIREICVSSRKPGSRQLETRVDPPISFSLMARESRLVVRHRISHVSGSRSGRSSSNEKRFPATEPETGPSSRRPHWGSSAGISNEPVTFDPLCVRNNVSGETSTSPSPSVVADPVHVPVMPGPQADSPSTSPSALTSGKTGLFAVGSPALFELGFAPGLAPSMQGRASERTRIPTAALSLEQRAGIGVWPRSVYRSGVHGLQAWEVTFTRTPIVAPRPATVYTRAAPRATRSVPVPS